MPEKRAYEELDMVPIPEDISELGVEAGRVGVVDFVYDEGRGLHVEVARKDGTTTGFVQMELRDSEAEEVWRVVAYSPFGSS